MTDTPSALSPEAKQSFTEAMLNAGRSQAEVDAALAPVERAPINPDGRAYSTAEQADAAVASTRAAAERRVAEAIKSHVALPGDGQVYDLNFKDFPMDMPRLARTNTEMQSALRTMAAPANLAAPLVNALLKSERAVAGMNANQLAQWKVEQRSMLSRMPGGTEGQLKDAAIATATLPEATRTAWLKSGRTDSMEAIVLLAHVGKAITARQKTS